MARIPRRVSEDSSRWGRFGVRIPRHGDHYRSAPCASIFEDTLLYKNPWPIKRARLLDMKFANDQRNIRENEYACSRTKVRVGLADERFGLDYFSDILRVYSIVSRKVARFNKAAILLIPSNVLQPEFGIPRAPRYREPPLFSFPPLALRASLSPCFLRERGWRRGAIYTSGRKRRRRKIKGYGRKTDPSKRGIKLLGATSALFSFSRNVRVPPGYISYFFHFPRVDPP